MLNLNFKSILSLMMLSFSVLIFSSCGSDDDATPSGCANFPTIGGEVEFNGDDLQLSVAQSLVNSAAGFGDSYTFQIGAVSSDCNELLTVNFNFTIASGANPSGTYAIKDFFSADDGDASGSFARQSLSPVSQSSVDMISGSVTVTQNSSMNYTLDLNAGLVGGDNVSMKMTHQF